MLDLRQNLVERRMIELDPDLAGHYLTFNTYETQRPIRPAHVAELSQKMKDGLFRFGEIAFAIVNGTADRMLNGQHVCEGVIDSNATIPCVLEKFRISNDRELSEAFRQFEILPRSLQDMVRVEAHSLKLSWPVRTASLVVSAATLERADYRSLSSPPGPASIRGGGGGHFTKEDKVRLLSQYLKEGHFLNDLLSFNNTLATPPKVLHLCRAPVAMVIMQTSRINKNDAGVFWCRVRDGELLKQKMPEMQLREFLLQSNSTRSSSKYNLRQITNHEFVYRCIVAWNAFRSNKPTRLAYSLNRSVPGLK